MNALPDFGLSFKHGSAKWNVETNYTYLDLDEIHSKFPGKYSDIIATNFVIHEHQHRHYGYTNYIFQIGRMNHVVNDIVFNDRQNKTLEEQKQLIYAGRIFEHGVFQDVNDFMEAVSAYVTDRDEAQSETNFETSKEFLIASMKETKEKIAPNAPNKDQEMAEMAELILDSRQGFKSDILSKKSVNDIYSKLMKIKDMTDSIGFPHFVIHYVLNPPNNAENEVISSVYKHENIILERFQTIFDALEVYTQNVDLSSKDWFQKLIKILDKQAGYTLGDENTTKFYELIKKISGVEAVIFNIPKFQNLDFLSNNPTFESAENLNWYNLLQIFHDPYPNYITKYQMSPMMNFELARFEKLNEKLTLHLFTDTPKVVKKTWAINWIQTQALNQMLEDNKISGTYLEMECKDNTSKKIKDFIPIEMMQKITKKVDNLLGADHDELREKFEESKALIKN